MGRDRADLQSSSYVKGVERLKEMIAELEGKNGQVQDNVENIEAGEILKPTIIGINPRLTSKPGKTVGIAIKPESPQHSGTNIESLTSALNPPRSIKPQNNPLSQIATQIVSERKLKRAA